MRITLATAGSICVLSGCTSFYPVQPDDAVAPAQTVAITFAAPRDLEAAHDTVTYLLPAVRKVYGKVESVRSDTLVLRVMLLESTRRQPDLPRDARLTVIPDATARIAMRRVSRGKTAALLSGVTLVGLLALALANFELGPCTNCSF